MTLERSGLADVTICNDADNQPGLAEYVQTHSPSFLGLRLIVSFPAIAIAMSQVKTSAAAVDTFVFMMFFTAEMRPNPISNRTSFPSTRNAGGQNYR